MMQGVASGTYAAGAATGSYNNLALVLLSLASVISSGSSLSLTRIIHDTDQDVVKNDLRGLPKVLRVDFKSSNISVTAGDRLVLECVVNGTPRPKIFWVRGENPEQQVQRPKSVDNITYWESFSEVSKLVIDCVTPQDQGLIYCVGLSADQLAISKPTVLNVQGRDVSSSSRAECQEKASLPPVITRFQSYQINRMGSTVELPCEASGKPQPEINWLSQDLHPLKDPRFVVQPNGSLIISNLTWNDVNDYTCVAKSSAGSDTTKSFIYSMLRSK